MVNGGARSGDIQHSDVRVAGTSVGRVKQSAAAADESHAGATP